MRTLIEFYRREDFPCDIDQLVEGVPYKTTKESMQFSLRALVKHGLVMKGDTHFRDKRWRRLIYVTPDGYESVDYEAIRDVVDE